MLNVAFLVPQMRREFGGCAGNIAYNLKLLCETGYPMGGIGLDFQPYSEWMKKQGMSEKYLVRIPEEHCAQAFITTDLDSNQITAFHPGAMNHSWKIKVPANDGISIGVIAPDSREGMLQHAEQFKAAGIPFIFDPGQAMPLFNGEEFRHFIEQADYVVVNDYESNLLQERTGWDEKTIAGKVKAYIITRGPQGALIHADGKSWDIPPAHERRITDPTGCGDAFRAGLIFGIEKGYDWLTIGRIGNLMGALKVEFPGTQNQRFDYAEFAEQFRQQFGYAL
jgi:adenosine kinase